MPEIPDRLTQRGPSGVFGIDKIGSHRDGVVVLANISGRVVDGCSASEP
jgi:hypothetical protein